MTGNWNGPVIERGQMAADVAGRDFTQLYNGMLRDPRITGNAKAVFAVIASHRDGYGVSVDAIAKYMYERRDAIGAALRCLEKYGYLVRVRERREDGTLGTSVYRITDMPNGLTITAEAPYERRSPRSAPETGNPSLAVTSGNDPWEASSPRSAPETGYPDLAEPDLADPSHKKTSVKNTKVSKKTEEDLSPRASSEELLLDLGATEDETREVLKRIKNENPGIRSLSAYVRRMAETGDLAAKLAEVRSAAARPADRPARPPRCDDSRHDRNAPQDRNLYDPTDPEDQGKPCPRCSATEGRQVEAKTNPRVHRSAPQPIGNAVADVAAAIEDAADAWSAA